MCHVAQRWLPSLFGQPTLNPATALPTYLVAQIECDKL